MAEDGTVSGLGSLRAAGYSLAGEPISRAASLPLVYGSRSGSAARRLGRPGHIVVCQAGIRACSRMGARARLGLAARVAEPVGPAVRGRLPPGRAAFGGLDLGSDRRFAFAISPARLERAALVRA